MFLKVAVFALLFLLTSTSAWAVQEHGGPEAFYVHQIAHIFFALSMVVLMVVLKKPLTAKSTGWRKIRLSALVFILWNVDAFFLHNCEFYVAPREAYITGGAMELRDVFSSFYYFGGLAENVFLAAAFILLAVGIKGLWVELKEVAHDA